MTIGDAGNHRTELDAVGAASGEGEGAPALEHFVFGWAYASYLEEVIHDPHAVETGALGAFCYQPEGVTKIGLAAGPGEVGDL